MSEPLSDQQLSLIDAYWRASNYLTVGQIYLMANPRYPERARELIKMTEDALDAHRKYVVEHLEDMPAIRNWKWTPG